MATAVEINEIGITQQRRGDFEAARLSYAEAYRLDPEFLPALANVAQMLARQGRLSTAVNCLRKVVAKFPHDPSQWLALGNALMRLEQWTEAKVALTRAAELRPENPDIWHNLGLMAYRRRDFCSAERYLDKVRELGVDKPEIVSDIAHVKLAQGNLAEGLMLYDESRWQTLVHSPAWDFHIPEWKGEDLSHKKILVHAEQGYGDTIMTSRFLVELDCDGITLAVTKDLIRLFDSQMWDMDVVDLAQLPENAHEVFDFQSPLYSVMRWLDISRDDIDPYPYLDAVVRGPKVPKINNVLDVGICWASGDRGDRLNWRRRVTDLKLWLPLAEVPNVRLWSLQKDHERHNIRVLGAEALVNDVTDDFSDWADTAGFVSQLDLVISVDTAAAHLAGAIGVPVWMISQHSPCWRWWNLENGNGLPWYDAMEIFWQSGPEDWAPVLNTVRNRLETLARDRRSKSWHQWQGRKPAQLSPIP